MVLDRNWRTRAGELDLVLGRADLVVVCEVKTRTSSAFGSALEAVTPTKAARVRRLGAAWLAAHATPGVRRRVRFDVAAITAGVLEVVEGAL